MSGEGEVVVSELVGLLQGQPSLDKFSEWASGFPKGTIVTQSRYGFEARTPGVVCGCWMCDQRERETLSALTGLFSIRLTGLMILCPDCGNKRCPKATRHDNPCSGSNDPNQPGSRYQYVPREIGSRATEAATGADLDPPV